MGTDRAAVVSALNDYDGNVSRAARALGVARRTLQNRMRKLGLPVGRAGRRPRKLHYRRGARRLASIGLGAAAVVGAFVVASKWRGSGA
jgi:hypothetical protein